MQCCTILRVVLALKRGDRRTAVFRRWQALQLVQCCTKCFEFKVLPEHAAGGALEATQSGHWLDPEPSFWTQLAPRLAQPTLPRSALALKTSPCSASVRPLACSEASGKAKGPERLTVSSKNT